MTSGGRFMPDSDCMISAVAIWHQHRARATTEIDRRLTRGETMVLAASTLIETFSVLTRLPQPQRVSPETALRVIEDNFVRISEIIALDSVEYLNLLRQAPRLGIVGGNVYDAVVVACARQAQVSTILTFNERHFRPLVGPDIEVVVPRTGADPDH